METTEQELKKRDKSVPRFDSRIDENGAQVLEVMGFKGRLPDALVRVYNDFKRDKDRVLPGRMLPEGYATVVALFKLEERIAAALGGPVA